MWFLLGPAMASEAPVVTTEADGTVVGVAVVAASEDAVRALLGDASRAAGLSPDVYDVTVEGEEGRCSRVRKHTRGVFRPFELLALRCPTEQGWTEVLVESGDFSSYALEWRVAPDAAGTRVEYRVRTKLSIPVPAAALRGAIEDATRTALVNLQGKVR
jgi:hypothetical protein